MPKELVEEYAGKAELCWSALDNEKVERHSELEDSIRQRKVDR